jgi:hydrogenase maturation protein HypF
MELESLAGTCPAAPLPFAVRPGPDGIAELDPLPLLIALGEARARGVDPTELAATFHESVATAAAQLAAQAAGEAGLAVVALGGGCFQNARLLASVRRRLTRRGMQVLVPRRLSPNDSAISYGQAAVAAAQLHREVAR